MASRPPNKAVNQVIRGGGKQNKVGAAGKSKRAPLNDIGNNVVVTARGPEGKAKPQITCPVTRRFGTRLLAKEQADAAKNKLLAKEQADAAENKIPVLRPNEANLGKKTGRVQKPTQKKVVTITKPKPVEEVIEISPDTAIEIKKEKPENEKASKSRWTRKKVVPTMTALLAARSKEAACGVVENKSKEPPIFDIDARDVDNELAVVEYVEDIYKFYKLMENESQVHDYMVSQPDINEKMRAILVDWLIEVHNKFDLMPETLYLTVNLVDRFLAVKMVPRRELQLLGISAMLIACKYEEIWAPEVDDFVCISDRVYTDEQILRMEKIILHHLEWELTVPTCYVFLVRFIKASIPDNEMEKNLVYFLAELSLMQCATIIYRPSMIAASAVLVARHTLSRSPLWTEMLELHTGYSESQLM